MKQAFLVIGDKKASKWRSAKPFTTFVRHIKKELKNKNTELKISSYKDVLGNNLPAFMSRTINIILFFPFEYWNNSIEVYGKDDRIYGDENFGKDYKRFFKRIEQKLKKAYIGKKMKYFNHPCLSVLERDKKKTKDLFRRKGIPAPRIFHVRNIKSIRNLIDSGKSLYIKPRFGALGKGVTYLSNDLFITNFTYRKGDIISRKSDYGWRFHGINKKDRNGFLEKLISKKFIFEEAVEHPVYKNKIFDFRVHVIYGKIPYYYAKTMPTSSPVTNWAQGGRIERKKDILEFTSRKNTERIKSLAIKATKALGLNYAGLDIILSRDFKKVYCLEAHSFPGYEKGFDIMRYIAKKIVKGRK